MDGAGSEGMAPSVSHTSSVSLQEIVQRWTSKSDDRTRAGLNELVGYVSRMELTRPEVLRATWAARALRVGCRAHRLRPGNLFRKSFQCERIGCFWSHSWHGSTWKKMLTLVVLYNGPAAMVMGSLLALVGAVLHNLDLLEGFPRAWDSRGKPLRYASGWAQGLGTLAAVLTLAMWQSPQKVFFDRICISENDEALKSEAILSLAGILRNSNEMLVLWDSSWSERLWCVFELSAFLKSKGGSSNLSIRPTFMGPCSIAAFFTVEVAMVPLTLLPTRLPGMSFSLPFVIPVTGLFVCVSCTAIGAVVVMRGYFRSVQELKERLRSSSLRQTRASCCEMEHLDGGQAMLCDREVVQKCIQIWFGSPAAFEQCVRVDVLEAMGAELDRGFGASWCLAVTCPLMWAFLDVASTHQKKEFAAEYVLEGIAIWLFWSPPTVQYFVFLTRYFCKRAKSVRGEVALNLMVVGLALPGIVAAALPWFLVHILSLGDGPDMAIARAAIFATCMMLYAAVMQVLSCRCGYLVQGRSR